MHIVYGGHSTLSRAWWSVETWGCQGREGARWRSARPHPRALLGVDDGGSTAWVSPHHGLHQHCTQEERDGRGGAKGDKRFAQGYKLGSVMTNRGRARPLAFAYVHLPPPINTHRQPFFTKCVCDTSPTTTTTTTTTMTTTTTTTMITTTTTTTSVHFASSDTSSHSGVSHRPSSSGSGTKPANMKCRLSETRQEGWEGTHKQSTERGTVRGVILSRLGWDYIQGVVTSARPQQRRRQPLS
jgi:hypothetical protein